MDNRSKPDSLLATLVAIGRLGLVLTGLIGVSVVVFRDNGLLNQLLDNMFSSSAWIIGILIAAVIIFYINRWLTAPRAKKMHSRGDLPLYLMMGIGAFFLFRLLTTGGF